MKPAPPVTRTRMGWFLRGRVAGGSVRDGRLEEPGRPVTGTGTAGGPLVELDLEGEAVGQVAVLGPRDRTAVGATGQPPHYQQRRAGRDLERHRVVLAGDGGGDGLA